jgi:two-component system, cell cycle response regulator
VTEQPIDVGRSRRARPRVLIAHGDGLLREELGGWLASWGCDPVFARDGREAAAMLRRDDAPRLAFLSSRLGDVDAHHLCRALRGGPLEPYVYVAILGEPGEAADVEAWTAAGADDYLAPPLDARHVRLRLESGRRVARLQDDLIAAREALVSRASTDALTGLWNRATVVSILDREIDRARREGGRVAVLLADVDHFKLVNDQLGHAAGDAVLRELAHRMAKVIRPYDALGRYGGEEFLFVLPGCDRAAAAAAAERLLDDISRDPVDLPNGPLGMTVSVGVASGESAELLDVERLVAAADAALYRAKRAGRNRVEIDAPPGDVGGAGRGPSRALLSTATLLVEDLSAAAHTRDVHGVRAASVALSRVAKDLGADSVVDRARGVAILAETGRWSDVRFEVEGIGVDVARFGGGETGR